MKYLKYKIKKRLKEFDMNGVEYEYEVVQNAMVPDTKRGRELAEREALFGEVEEYDDGEEEIIEEPTTEERLELLEEAVAKLGNNIEKMLERLGL